MQRHSTYRLRIWLLAMLVLFAPMEAAVSAIDMLDHGKMTTEHCMMGQQDQAEHNDDGSDDCCQNGFGCAKCISVHTLPMPSLELTSFPLSIYSQILRTSAQGILGHAEYRPPRSFS